MYMRPYRDVLNLLLEYLKKNENLRLSEISFDITMRQTVEGYFVLMLFSKTGERKENTEFNA